MIKTFIVTGDLNQGEGFHVTDSENIDQFVKDPLTMLSVLENMGYHLIQVIPTLYHYANARLSLHESVWVFTKHTEC